MKQLPSLSTGSNPWPKITENQTRGKQNILMEAEVGEEQTDMGIYKCNTSANVSSAKQVYKYSKFIVHTFSLLQFFSVL